MCLYMYNVYVSTCMCGVCVYPCVYMNVFVHHYTAIVCVFSLYRLHVLYVCMHYVYVCVCALVYLIQGPCLYRPLGCSSNSYVTSIFSVSSAHNTCMHSWHLAGMFFFRNSSWSMQFLDLWWNQTSFIRPFGQKKSGDNDALKFLIRNMPDEERKRHVRIPKMQCVFNSNLWQPSLKSGHRLVTLTKTVWQGWFNRYVCVYCMRNIYV